jgi:signal transduction histidine kinase
VQIQSESCQEEIFADGDRLIQVLVNLLSNASKFSPKNSIVHITCTATNGSLQFSVSDTGRGIPKDKIGSLFEKFSQADEKDGRRGVGTGLGLSICKTIVELHGGQINAESEIGKGSRFWFVIPRTSTEEPAK